MLLFVIGLELQPSRLWVLRHAVFGNGTMQVLLTTAGLAVIVRLTGQAWLASVIIGFALSLSSTALILQVLAERGELTARHGRSAFAILLFQDLAIMPVLVALPLLAGTAGSEFSWRAVAMPVGTVLVVVVAGRYLLAAGPSRRGADAIAGGVYRGRAARRDGNGPVVRARGAIDGARSVHSRCPARR